MTTSILLTNGEYLNDYDLQVLADYALEAPYEWRKALEQLLAHAREQRDAAVIQSKLDDAESDLRDARKKLDELNTQLYLLVPGVATDQAKYMDAQFPKLRQSLETLHNQYTELYESLSAATDATDAKPSGPPPPSGVGAGDPGSRSPA